MRRLGHRLFYLLETLFSRGPVYQLMLVASVIVVLSLVGGVAVHLVNPQAYAHTGEAIWWAFLRLTDPGYLGEDQGLFPRTVSTFLTLAGYVVFLGALVALMTNWLDQSLKFLASGRSPIFEEGHILIIGWNERLHSLIEELVRSFTQGANQGNPSIVVLCPNYQASMRDELLQRLHESVRSSCQLLIRSGDPLELESLERVDFRFCRSIILLSDDKTDRASRALSDTSLAKILMTLKANYSEQQEPPTVVVEVANPANKLLIESVGWGVATEAVVADEIMGRLFCQAVRFPGISRVYHQLLTDSFGDQIVLRQAGTIGAAGRSLRETASSLREGTVIGSLSKAGELSLLNLDQVPGQEDSLVLVASKHPRRIASLESASELSLTPKTSRKGRTGSVLIIGWSTELYTLVQELGANEDENYKVTFVWEKDYPLSKQRLIHLAEQCSNVEVEFQAGTLLEETEIAALGVESYQKIVLLGEHCQSPLVADAENVLRYVLLDRLIKKDGLKTELVVELNDEDNRSLLNGVFADMLVTGEILSHLLAKVSAQPMIMSIYEELFTKGGAELSLHVVGEGGQSFGEILNQYLQVDAVALGLYRQGEVHFNPSFKEKVRADDQVIVVELD